MWCVGEKIIWCTGVIIENIDSTKYIRMGAGGGEGRGFREAGAYHKRLWRPPSIYIARDVPVLAIMGRGIGRLEQVR